MTSYDRRLRSLAACLSAVAGFVDATAFIHLGGFFVSFMSGNTTRLGVGLAESSLNAAVAFLLIATFVAGVAIGSATGHLAGQHRRPVVLLLVAGLLATAGLFGWIDDNPAATMCMALAMGAENAVFERDGEIRIGLTYMTGTLVRIGQRIGARFVGGERQPIGQPLSLWLALAAGAFAGAEAYGRIGLASLWVAAAAMVLLTLAAVRIDRALSL